jgi:sugar phosphate isomerase/epimerase
MTYEVGISTGWYSVAKTADLLGLAAKIAYGATTGVQFVQVDLETTSEFLEPGLAYQVSRVIKELGMKVGVHAEIGEVLALESAEYRLWEQAQIRLCETVEHAAKLGMLYVNVHLSVKPQMIYEEARYMMQGYFYPVVGCDGNPIHVICDEVPAAKVEAERNISLQRGLIDEEAQQSKYNEIVKEERIKAQENLKQQIAALSAGIDAAIKAGMPRQQAEVQFRQARAEIEYRVSKEMEDSVDKRFKNPGTVYEMWKNSPYGKYVLTTGEIGAYRIVAAYMKDQRDPLWENICGGDPVTAYRDKHGEFNAAVAAKYIEGHLLRKNHKANKEHLEGMSIKEWCDKKGIYLLFETAHAAEGMEGLIRLYSPLHAYHLIKKLNSPHIKQCIDFEHMLANKLEPDKVIEKLPDDAGKQVFLFHLGRPIPYFGTAHVQIPRGSHAQEHIYRWLWMMRNKGFRDGYIIYERGGGQTPLEVVQDTVQTLRLIAEELEKGTNPDELPASFYGVSEQNEAVFARQRVAVRDNFMAPITGLVSIPEETHTFLGRAAIEKGRAEEWKKGKYR